MEGVPPPPPPLLSTEAAAAAFSSPPVEPPFEELEGKCSIAPAAAVPAAATAMLPAWCWSPSSLAGAPPPAPQIRSL